MDSSPSPLDDYINAPEELPDKWAIDSFIADTAGGGGHSDVASHPTTAVGQFESIQQKSNNCKSPQATLSARALTEPQGQKNTTKDSQIQENGQGKISEEEKWVELYETLFPHDELVPAPYQGPVPVEQLCNDHQNDRSMLERFEEWSRAEFQRRVHLQIEGLPDCTHEQTESLTRKLVDEFQGLFETFRQSLPRVERSLNAAERAGLEQETLGGIGVQLGSTSISPRLGMREGASEPGLVLAEKFGEETPGQLDDDFEQFLEGNPIPSIYGFEGLLASMGTQE
ncbi:hypothetical protein B0J13DRAFT_619594 [Dactylonectria estremocensis]|uniref:Uncharacterized protein n=1 Tax=Dactylonectria estremocensis TaxID=1079267 RepID=A0A9P9F030_9HYPO|nr:hypothetical protein B0J13DRAFT_619594 [Dactylonectria estremocensis]